MLGHHALIYSSPDEFRSCGVDFVRQGLDQGDAVVVATRNATGLVAALGNLADPVEVADEHDWHRVPAWTIGTYARRAERSARRGHRLRVLVELRWDDPGAAAEWERYESVLNVALAGLPVDLCCAYDARSLRPELLDAARRTHPATIGPDGAQASAGYVATSDFLAASSQPARLTVPSGALSIEFGAAEIPAVRQTALAWALEAGLPDEDAHELLIAIYEIASNAVEHGGGRGTGHFWSDGTCLYCEVGSALPIVEPMLAGYQPPGTAQERGRGLWLARQICERVMIYNNGGATVQLVRSVASR